MRILQKIITWITSLESGETFQKWSAMFLKFLGVVALIFSIVLSIVLFYGVISDLGPAIIISSVLKLIVSIILVFFNFGVGTLFILLFWNRARTVSDLDKNTDFILLKIAIIFIRLSGEVTFIAYITVGIYGLISGIFGIELISPYSFMPLALYFDVSISFDTYIGIFPLITTVLSGIIALICSYLVASLLNLVIGMATDIKKIEATTRKSDVDIDSE